MSNFPDESLFSSPVDCARCKLNLGELMKKPRETKGDRCQAGERRVCFVRRCLDFGETELSVLLSHPGKSNLHWYNVFRWASFRFPYFRLELLIVI